MGKEGKNWGKEDKSGRFFHFAPPDATVRSFVLRSDFYFTMSLPTSAPYLGLLFKCPCLLTENAVQDQ